MFKSAIIASCAMVASNAMEVDAEKGYGHGLGHRGYGGYGHRGYGHNGKSVSVSIEKGPYGVHKSVSISGGSGYGRGYGGYGRGYGGYGGLGHRGGYGGKGWNGGYGGGYGHGLGYGRGGYG